MDGENNGKPYEQMDNLGGGFSNPYFWFNTQIFINLEPHPFHPKEGWHFWQPVLGPRHWAASHGDDSVPSCFATASTRRTLGPGTLKRRAMDFAPENRPF